MKIAKYLGVAFVAELDPFSILKLALWAFHFYSV
jgi:hypothetical protein